MRQEFTKQTKREALTRSSGFCEGLLSSGERCNANLWQKLRHFDHIIPCAIGGDNSLQNCQVLCVPCHDEKTWRRDLKIIAKSKRVSDKHQGIKIKSRGFAKRQPQRTATRPIQRRAELLGN